MKTISIFFSLLLFKSLQTGSKQSKPGTPSQPLQFCKQYENNLPRKIKPLIEVLSKAERFSDTLLGINAEVKKEILFLPRI